MSFTDSLQYRLENASIYFQGGVRRTVLVFGGVCLVLLAPIYFLGQLSSNLYKNTWFNSNNIVIPKTFNALDYLVSETQVVSLINGDKDLYISINNKTNKTSGLYPWVYTLQTLDSSDKLISQQTFQSYLLPEETRYIVSRTTGGLGAKLKLIKESKTLAVDYNPNANQLLKNPNISIESQSVKSKDDKSLEVRALFKNNDQVSIGSVQVLYIIRDTRQSVVGIGTYQFNGFTPGSEREMLLTYPKPLDREAATADIRWSVNYLDNTNIKLG